MTETKFAPLPPHSPDNEIDRIAHETSPNFVHTDPMQFMHDALSSGRVTDEMVEAALANADVMKPTARVEVRMPTDAFLTMVSTDGIYKTIHDGQKSQGGRHSRDQKRYLDNRKGTEERLGLADQNIVYGYLGNTAELDTRTQALGYGRIALILKPEVTERSSFSAGDSMIDLFEDRRLMTFETAVVAKELNDIVKYTARGDAEHYIEAQIYGGVSMDDIEQVSFTSGTNDPESIRTFIEAFQQNTEDISLIVRIPVDSYLTLQSFELAQEFSSIHFIFCVSLEGKPGSGIVQHPYITAHKNEHIKDRRFAERRMNASNEAYAKAKQRAQDLQENARSKWQKNHPGVDFPPNVNVVIEQAPGK